MSPPTCTTEEAARLLRVTPRRVRQLKGEIGYATHGRALVFDREAVLAYAREHGYGGPDDGETADGGRGA